MLLTLIYVFSVVILIIRVNHVIVGHRERCVNAVSAKGGLWTGPWTGLDFML